MRPGFKMLGWPAMRIMVGAKPKAKATNVMGWSHDVWAAARNQQGVKRKDKGKIVKLRRATSRSRTRADVEVDDDQHQHDQQIDEQPAKQSVVKMTGSVARSGQVEKCEKEKVKMRSFFMQKGAQSDEKGGQAVKGGEKMKAKGAEKAKGAGKMRGKGAQKDANVAKGMEKNVQWATDEKSSGVKDKKRIYDNNKTCDVKNQKKKTCDAQDTKHIFDKKDKESSYVKKKTSHDVKDQSSYDVKDKNTVKYQDKQSSYDVKDKKSIWKDKTRSGCDVKVTEKSAKAMKVTEKMVKGGDKKSAEERPIMMNKSTQTGYMRWRHSVARLCNGLMTHPVDQIQLLRLTSQQRLLVVFHLWMMTMRSEEKTCAPCSSEFHLVLSMNLIKLTIMLKHSSWIDIDAI